MANAVRALKKFASDIHDQLSQRFLDASSCDRYTIFHNRRLFLNIGSPGYGDAEMKANCRGMKTLPGFDHARAVLDWPVFKIFLHARL